MKHENARFAIVDSSSFNKSVYDILHKYMKRSILSYALVMQIFIKCEKLKGKEASNIFYVL